MKSRQLAWKDIYRHVYHYYFAENHRVHDIFIHAFVILLAL